MNRRAAGTLTRSHRWRGGAVGIVASLVLMGLFVSGCASRLDGAGYYWQSISGHLDLMRAGRPIGEALDDPLTAGELRDKLAYVVQAREFASAELGLPRNGSYTRYAPLERDHVLWNVFATPELSLQLQRWCFPVAGCIAYRGYYAKEDAEAFARSLEASGMDVQVGGVPAYSTLGWFDDPLPSPVLRFPSPEIARLIFHELAHQVLYVKGDSTFNESFATAVERLGMSRWLAYREAQGEPPGVREQYARLARRKHEFVMLLRQTREQLQSLYAAEATDDDKRQGKKAVFDSLRDRYLALRRDVWDGWSGYDRWFDRPLGNAHLAAVGAYHDRVPAFEALFRAQGGDLARFYDQARLLAALPRAERDQRLDALAAGRAGGSPTPRGG